VGRTASARTPLARVRPGDAACTSEGHVGIVVDIDGALALLAVQGGDRADGIAGIWVRRERLCEVVPGEVPPRLAAMPVFELRSELRRLPQPRGAAREQRGRFFELGRFAYEARGSIVIGAVVCVAACLPLAAGVHDALSSGGFVPQGEAMRVEDRLQDEFQAPATEVSVLVEGHTGQVTERVAKVRGDLMRIDGVHSIADPEPALDGGAVLLNVGLTTTDDAVTRGAIAEVRRTLERAKVGPMRMAGRPVFSKDVEEQTRADLTRAELIGVPAALLVLLIVFGTIPAAMLPIAIGGMSVVVSLAIVHLVAMATDVSLFVLNVTTLLAFGLGIDYSLMAISRFRSELARGRSVETATVTTTITSGRAVFVSGVAVLLGMAGMAAMPLGVMRSIAIGGAIVVAVTVAMATIVMPAMLALLGHRIEAMPVRRIDPDGEGRQAAAWRRLTSAVMRRPGIVVLVVLAAAVAVALPATGARLEVPLQSALPASAESRVAVVEIERAFDRVVSSPMLVVADTTDEAAQEQLADRLRAVPNVAEVQVRAHSDHGTLLSVTTRSDPQGGSDARTTLREIRRIDGEKGLPRFEVGGQFAWEQEFFDLLAEHLPTVLAIVFCSAFVVLLVAFRSLVVPLKAIVLNVVSITATLGIVVLVFQHGFGVGLIGSSQLGWVDASLPIVLFCLLFGLSMDYEVFMLSSIAERWQDGLDTTEATADGIARTAPLVTGAALILVVLGLAFASTELVLVKQIGFGVAVALLLDATIVRALLVPGTMRLLGDWNWWLPAALAKRLPTARWT
jgi:RND superfamily putative drug exporter